jgi:hypothetical protein
MYISPIENPAPVRWKKHGDTFEFESASDGNEERPSFKLHDPEFPTEPA